MSSLVSIPQAISQENDIVEKPHVRVSCKGTGEWQRRQRDRPAEVIQEGVGNGTGMAVIKSQIIGCRRRYEPNCPRCSCFCGNPTRFRWPLGRVWPVAR